MIEAISYYVTQLVSGIKFKSVLWGIVSGIEFLIGGWTMAIRGLIFMICADFILGIAESFRSRTFKFSKMRNGLYKILLYAVAIGVGHNIDFMLFHSAVDFGFRNLIIVFLGVNESLSVLRHLANFNVPIPNIVISKLKSIEREMNGKD